MSAFSGFGGGVGGGGGSFGGVFGSSSHTSTASPFATTSASGAMPAAAGRPVSGAAFPSTTFSSNSAGAALPAAPTSAFPTRSSSQSNPFLSAMTTPATKGGAESLTGTTRGLSAFGNTTSAFGKSSSPFVSSPQASAVASKTTVQPSAFTVAFGNASAPVRTSAASAFAVATPAATPVFRSAFSPSGTHASAPATTATTATKAAAATAAATRSSLVTKSAQVSQLPMANAPVHIDASSPWVPKEMPSSTAPSSTSTKNTADPTVTSTSTTTTKSTATTTTSTNNNVSCTASLSVPGREQSPHVMMMTHGTSPPFKFCPSPLSSDAAAASASWKMPSSTSDNREKPLTTTKDTPNAAGGRAELVGDAAGELWVCQVCLKRKDLSGPHLKDKLSVRSDCWPCGKKQTFIRTSAPAAAAGVSGGEKRVAPAAAHTFSAKADGPAASAVVAAGGGSLAVPRLPINTGDEVYLPDADSSPAIGTRTMPPQAAAVMPSTTASRSPSMLFDQELLRAYRHRLVAGIPLRCVWCHHVLYVIAPDTPRAVFDAATNSFRFPMAGEVCERALPVACDAGDAHSVAQVDMGRFASLFLAIDHKIASSPFKRIGRIFCSNDFSYAAACTYADRFARAPENMPPTPASASSQEYLGQFKVFGPAKDPTAGPTMWNSIIEYCPFSESKVVSLEQRIEASARVYRSTSWMILPENTTAAAILHAIETNNNNSNNNGGGLPSLDAADVVLLPETMKLEDLSKFPALTQSS